MPSAADATSNIEIVRYDPRYQDDFARLNLAWIEQYFKVEAADRRAFEETEVEIIRPGGEIFFALRAGQVIATVAMIAHPDSFELTKMAVDPNARGHGVGALLIETCLAFSRERNIARVYLLSNTVLEPAIRLYKRQGFRTVHLGPHPDYERANIEMEWIDEDATPGASD
jgi:N-acetylglutamate synthase-like GNAT family acetyltransferase